MLLTLFRCCRVCDWFLFEYAERAWYDCMMNRHRSMIDSRDTYFTLTTITETFFYNLRLGKLETFQTFDQCEETSIVEVTIIIQTDEIGVDHPTTLTGDNREVREMDGVGANSKEEQIHGTHERRVHERRTLVRRDPWVHG